jgi:hypothetical protein
LISLADEHAKSLGHRVCRRIAAGDMAQELPSAPSCRACMSKDDVPWLVGLADAVQHLDGPRLVIGYALLGGVAGAEDQGELRDKAYHLSWFSIVRDVETSARSASPRFLHIHYTHAGSPGPTSS